MNKGKVFLAMTLALGSVSAFAAKESSIQFQNSVRVGYDDNIYQERDGHGSAFVTDIINLTGKLHFSSRSDLLLYWQPEFRYRDNADPNGISYQDLYGKYSHALSQRVYMQVSDRLRYQDKDAQAGNVDVDNQNYLENSTDGALDFTLNERSVLTLGASYELRNWEDKDYGQGNRNNDFNHYTGDASVSYDLKPNTSKVLLGVNYDDYDYEGNRGGYYAGTLYAGVDQALTANIRGTARLGYSYTKVENYTDDDSSSTPYLQAGLEYNPTARTTLSTSFVASMYNANNSYYNAQDRLTWGVGLRHDLTGKISLSSSFGYTYSSYDGDYAIYNNPQDTHQGYTTFSLRASYQINRNNFVDAGYQLSDVAADSEYLNEFTRNVFDIGWRLRL